jgi:hypothetical protein
MELVCLMMGAPRFLRARKFDVALAKTMIINSEKWRKDFGVDDIVKYVAHHSFS